MAFQCINLVFIAIFITLATLASQATSRALHEPSLASKHEQWMAKHGRIYADAAEKERRLGIFKKNVEYVEKFNNEGNKTYELSINKFSDMTKEEFQRHYTGYQRTTGLTSTPSNFTYKSLAASDIPTSMDWREKQAVTPIKDQGHCENGLALEESYPYQGTDTGTCNSNKESEHAAQITGYAQVTPNNEDDLLKAVAMQPITVTIEADGQDFMQYSSGVFANENCGTRTNHAVTAIGYGTSEEGMAYWLIKNSWGEQWGESGYLRILRNTDASGGPGMCGLATNIIYPTA